MEKDLLKVINDADVNANADFLSNLKLKFMPTRSRLLNMFLSNKKKDGGIIYGRDGITVITGDPSCGKTLLAAEFAVSFQKAGGVVVYIDTEHAVNKDYFLRLGADIDKFIITSPHSLETCFSIIEKTVLSIRDIDNTKPVVVIWDSVAASAPSYEQDDSTYDPQATIGLGARIISKALRKINPLISRKDVSLIFVNQLRSSIGMYAGEEIEYGGKALQYYASTKVKLKRTEFIKNKDDNVIGIKTKFILTKSRVGNPRKEIVFRIYHDYGIDELLSLKDLLVKYGYIKTSGAWSTIECIQEKPKFRGDDEFKELMQKSDYLEQCYLAVESKIIDYYA